MKKFFYHLVTRVVKVIFEILCRIDRSELHKVPAHGPLILAANHVNFLEVPVMYTQLYPRPIKGLSKEESWKNPLFHILFNLWNAIPIKRGTVDTQAFEMMQDALDENFILAVAPEGTRSRDGKLLRGFPGIALLAARTDAPIMPLVYYGGEKFWENIRRFRRTDFNIAVGNPFTINLDGVDLTREVRNRVTNELMYQLAALLPPEYRGYYSDLENATENYLSFAQGMESNLKRAAITP